VPEAAKLRDSHVERRLAAFEPGRNRAAGAGLLSLRPAAGCLALAGRDAAPDASPGDVRAVRWAEIVQLHDVPSLADAAPSAISSTETRKRTCRTMPRVAGLSGISTVCPIRLSPMARTVARLRAMWLIVLFVWVTRSLPAIGSLHRGRRRLSGDP